MSAENWGSLLCGCWAMPLAVMAAVLFVAHALAEALRRRGLTAGQVHCGRCRYNVRGIGSWQCPECGGDLRNVGILTRDISEPFPLASRVILWSLAMPGPIILLFIVVSALLPLAKPVQWGLSLVGVTHIANAPDRRVYVTGKGTQKGSRLEMRQLSFQFVSNGSPRGTLHVDMPDRTFVTRDWSNPSGDSPRKPVTEPAITESVALQFPGNADVAAAQASDVMAVIDAAAAGRQPSQVRTRHFAVVQPDMYTGDPEPSVVLIIIAIIVGVIVWIDGFRRVDRAYRQQRHETSVRKQRILLAMEKSINATRQGDAPAGGPGP